MSKELEERLIQKYEAYEENRKNQLQSVVTRLQDHVRMRLTKHISPFLFGFQYLLHNLSLFIG